MAGVPTYGEQKVQEQGLPQVRMGDFASVANFGGGQAVAGAFEAASGAMGEAKDIALNEKRKADETIILGKDADLAKLQTDTQIATSKMLGQDAMAAPDYAAKAWQDNVAKLREGLQDDSQREAFDRAAAGRFQELNRHVSLHVSDQVKKVNEETVQASLEASKNNATVNAFDDATVSTEIAHTKAVVEQWARNQGVYTDADGKVSPIFQQKLQDQLSGIHRDVLAARLDKDTQDGVDAGRAYFDAHKDEMSAKDMLASRNMLEKRETVQQGMEAWDSVSSYRLADGTPDERKMEQSIMSRDDLSAEKKLRVWDYVKGRAGEALVQKHQRDQANDASFMNQLTDARKQGVSLQDALKLADRFGTDSHDTAVKEAAVRKTYAPADTTDPQAYVNLRERVEGGNATKDEIDAAYLVDNKLSTSDWERLRENYYKTATEGHSPQMKLVNNQINDLARTTFGANTTKRNTFLHAIDVETQGLPPEEKYKKAQDMLKKDPSTEHHWLWMESLPTFGGVTQWESAKGRNDATVLAIGKAQEEVGPDAIKHIGHALGVDQITPQHIDLFASNFGGYDNIKLGTPVNNAIHSLAKGGKPAEPKNIYWLLKRAKDGRY